MATTNTTNLVGGQNRAEFLCDTAGCFLTVRIRGEIDHHTAAAIRQGIDATLFEKRPKKLILDLSAVSFMDSSGLGLIMGRFSVMKELGGDMTVWNPSRETRSILTLAGMERLVKIEYPADSPDGIARGMEQARGQARGRTPEASRKRSSRPRSGEQTRPGGGQAPQKRRKAPAAVGQVAQTADRAEGNSMDRKEKDA